MVNPKNHNTTKKQSKLKPPTMLGSSRIEKYYNKIVAGFIILTALLVVAIIYFSFSKTTIIVRPKVMEKEFTWNTTVKELSGLILVTEVEGSKTYTDLTTTGTKPDKARGTVTIINNYNQNQPLVEQTRLLSKEGVLFRTQKTVTVPAGGSVDVEVAADEEGEKGNIAASQFEIVALWAGLKDKIYAVSESSMSGGLVSANVVSAENIQSAKSALRDELAQQAYDLFKEELQKRQDLPERPVIPQPSTEAYAYQYIINEANVSAGAEVNGFDVTQKIEFATPILAEQTLLENVNDNIKKALDAAGGGGWTLTATPNLNAVQWQLSELNEDKTDGKITLDYTVGLMITTDHDSLKVTNLTGKTKEEVQKYLGAFPEITAVDVQFSPFWVTKTPALTDHIMVKIGAPR